MSSCRRSRELLELFRYGQFEAPASEPQLRHLESCARCQAEIGFDRELVRELKRAVRARVDGAAPSPSVWAAIRREAETQRAGWRVRWASSLRMLGRGVGGAVAVSGLAVALIVFGGGRQLPLSADGRGSPAPVAAAGVREVSALADPRRVPAEVLLPPTRPRQVGVDSEVLQGQTGKSAGGVTVEEDTDEVASQIVRLALATEGPAPVIAASVAEPVPPAPRSAITI